MTDIPTPKPAPITGLPIATALTLWCPFVMFNNVASTDLLATNRGMRLHYGDPESQVQQAFKCIATGCMSWFPDSSAPTTHGTCKLISGSGIKA